MKNLRKIDNLNLLLITKDLDCKVKIEKLFSKKVKILEVVDNKDDLIEKLKTTKFELALVDLDIDTIDVDSIFSIINENYLLNTIVLSGNTDDTNLLCAINNNVYTFLPKPLNAKTLKLTLLMCINQTKRGDKIDFSEGVYFDIYRQQLFNKNNGLIELTKLEFGVVKLLIESKDETISYQDIKNEVWKKKKMSIYTMRNIVNKIRSKTYYHFIQNYSGEGYRLDESK